MAGGRQAASTYFPLQPETLAYVSQGSIPTPTWLDQVNSLIYRLKANGAWAPMLSGFLFCATNEALALSDLKGRVRATKGGAPTFTPGQGYGGTFSGTDYIDIPVSDSDQGTTTAPKLFAGVLDKTTASANFAGSSATIVGAPGIASASTVCLDYVDSAPVGFSAGGFNMQQAICLQGVGSALPLICARNGTGAIIYPGCSGNSNVTGGGSFASLRTGSSAGGVLTRYCAMLLFLSTATDAQVQAAAMALATFLYDTGALP
jgi:hypothetical protein